jgi:hypothetical protein
MLDNDGEDQLDRSCKKNKELLYRVEEERNTLQRIKRRKGSWIGHIWRRNCLLKHAFEGKMEG